MFVVRLVGVCGGGAVGLMKGGGGKVMVESN